ncbi:MAG: oligosaccharide flippase family protein [Bacteroidota bacterium]
MSLLKKLAGETAIYGISSILSRLLNFVILTPYLTRAFVPGEYGVVSDMYTYAALLMVLFTFRMETAFFRFASKKGQMDRTFSTATLFLLGSTSILVVLLVSFSQQIADLLLYPDNRDYVIWFIFIIAFDTLAAIPFARLRLDNRPLRFATIKTLNILINIGFIFLFLEGFPYLIEQGMSGINRLYDPENRITYVFLANLMASAVTMLLLLPEYRRLRFTFDQELWNQMMAYALPLVIVGLAAVTNQLLNLPLMKHYLPGSTAENIAQVGIYSACYKIAILMSLFIQAFNYAAEPFFFRNANRDDARHIYAQVGQAFAMVGSLGFLGIMLYLDIFKHLVDSNFWTGLGIVPILLLAFFFLGLYYNFSIWFKLKDRTIIGAYISVTGALITISLNLVLLPRIGFYGAAYAALACYGFMACASYLTGRYHYPINYPIYRMLAYILLALLFYGLSTLYRPMLEGRWLLILPINTLVLLAYIALLYFLEKDRIRQFLRPTA